MTGLLAKAAIIVPGTFGCFYRSSEHTHDGYLCHPFVFETTPTDDQARDMTPLWQGKWQLGFRLRQLTTGRGRLDADDIRMLRTVVEWRNNSGESYEKALRLIPILTFVPAKLYESDWQRICTACA